MRQEPKGKSLQEKFDALDRETRAEFALIDARINGMEHRSDEFDSAMRKLGVMYESLDGKFRLLVEGFCALDKKIEALGMRMEERFAVIEYQFEVVFKRFDEIDGAA